MCWESHLVVAMDNPNHYSLISALTIRALTLPLNMAPTFVTCFFEEQKLV